MADTEKTQNAAGGVISFMTTLWTEMMRTRLTLIAAGVAFYGLLALFPGIGAIMAVAGMMANPGQVADTLSQLSGVLPDAAAEIIIGQAEGVAATESSGLGVMAIIGVLLTVYSASKGMQALIDGMNIINDLEESRSLVRATAVKLTLTFGLILGFVVCVAMAVAMSAVVAWLPESSRMSWVLSVIRWPILLTIGALGLTVIYRVGPSRHYTPWRWILPGAGLACLLWLTGTAGFALYVQYFGAYQETFGALGGVVILLMWLWLSAVVILFGGLVAKLLDQRRGMR